VTDDLLQKPNPTAGEITTQTQIRNDLKNKYGWFITLENNGEKCLARAVIFSGVVYYTTFTPDFADVGDICSLGEGTGRVYALQYASGMAAFNLDLTNDAEGQPPPPPTIYKSDRSMDIGGGIPSQVVVAVIKGDLVGYIGIGGGVFSPEMASKKNILPLFWRTVF
jgi:type IV pilus assembly protein PilY1